MDPGRLPGPRSASMRASPWTPTSRSTYELMYGVAILPSSDPTSTSRPPPWPAEQPQRRPARRAPCRAGLDVQRLVEDLVGARPRAGRRRRPRPCAPPRRPGRSATTAAAPTRSTVGLLQHVGDDGHHLGALRAAPSALDLGQGRRRPRGQHQPGARPGELPGRRATDAAGRAGHDDDVRRDAIGAHGLSTHLDAAVLLLLEDLVACGASSSGSLVGGEGRARRAGRPSSSTSGMISSIHRLTWHWPIRSWMPRSNISIIGIGSTSPP